MDTPRSQSIKAGLAAAKARGVKLGSARPGHWEGREDRRGYRAATAAAAEKRRTIAAEANRLAARLAAHLRRQGNNWRTIAEELNRKGYRTTRGNRWTASKAYRLHARGTTFTHH